MVNYGVPPFAGRSSRDFDREALARELRAVLAAFEPRLKESATKVTVTTSDKTAGLAIEIDGLLIMSPAPERLRLRTIDRPRHRPGADRRCGRPEMDRVFLEYYEEELTHIRALAAEFADLHPAVARNLSLDTVPCPDPYVERLLEGVAFLAARTRLKLDGEGARFARAVLDALYPDLVAPTPAVGMVALKPGQQVQTMLGRPRGAARHPARRRPAPRALDARHLHHRPGRDALADRDRRASPTTRTAARSPPPGSAPSAARRGEAALRVTLRRAPARARSPSWRSTGSTSTSATAPRRRRSSTRSSAPASRSAPRPAGPASALAPVGAARRWSASRDDEALMPRTRAGFEGYRLLREYFIMPERFHFARIDGLRAGGRRARRPRSRSSSCFRRPAPELADLRPADLALFATPVDQPLRARLQRHRDRPAPAAPGAARRPHPAARLRDLPRDRARGRRPRRAGGAAPGALQLRPDAAAGAGLVGRAPPAPPRRGRAPPGPDAHLLRRRRRLPRRSPARAAPRARRDRAG